MFIKEPATLTLCKKRKQSGLKEIGTTEIQLSKFPVDFTENLGGDRIHRFHIRFTIDESNIILTQDLQYQTIKYRNGTFQISH